MSKIELLSKRISEIRDFQKFKHVFCTEERKEFAILSDYKGQSYVIINHNEETCTIKVNDIETIIERDDTKLFQIYNAKQVIFIPIDGKEGLLAHIDSFCDAILFDVTDFCFIEFKLNAISAEESAVRKNRKKAISQLSNTIDLFDEKLARDYEGLNLEAYVCTPLVYPRNDASWKKLSVEFLEKYSIPIFETNEKMCK
jgi:hypothetical protein